MPELFGRADDNCVGMDLLRDLGEFGSRIPVDRAELTRYPELR